MESLDYTLRRTTGGVRLTITGPADSGKSLLRGRAADIVRTHGGRVFTSEEDEATHSDILVASTGWLDFDQFGRLIAAARNDIHRLTAARR